VDDGIYTAFREWVVQQYGEQYANVGRALDRAMLEYMDRDRYARIESEVTQIRNEVDQLTEQTRKNEALLRQIQHAVGVETAREKGKTEVTPDLSVPTGKSPGDRREREHAVIRALRDADVRSIRGEALKEAIETVAGVSSAKTKQSYAGSITDTAAFRQEGINQWVFDPEGADEVLSQPR